MRRIRKFGHPDSVAICMDLDPSIKKHNINKKNLDFYIFVNFS